MPPQSGDTTPLVVIVAETRGGGPREPSLRVFFTSRRMFFRCACRLLAPSQLVRFGSTPYTTIFCGANGSPPLLCAWAADRGTGSSFLIGGSPQRRGECAGRRRTIRVKSPFLPPWCSERKIGSFSVLFFCSYSHSHRYEEEVSYKTRE